LRDDVIRRQLSDAIVRGEADTAQAKAKILGEYSDDPTGALDDLYDAFRAAESLHTVGEFDQQRFAASVNAAIASLNVLKSSLIPRQSRFTARICVGRLSGGNDFLSAIMAAMLAAAGHQVTDLSRSTTPKELLRNAEQNGAELLVVCFNAQTIGLARGFATEFESGGFRNKFDAAAFYRGSPSAPFDAGPFAFVASEPLELLSKATEYLIRSRTATQE